MKKSSGLYLSAREASAELAVAAGDALTPMSAAG